MATIEVKEEFGCFIATSPDYPTLYVFGESREHLSERVGVVLIELEKAVVHEREAIKAIVAEHAAWGRSFGVEDICDKIIAAINARSEREG